MLACFKINFKINLYLDRNFKIDFKIILFVTGTIVYFVKLYFSAKEVPENLRQIVGKVSFKYSFEPIDVYNLIVFGGRAERPD